MNVPLASLVAKGYDQDALKKLFVQPKESRKPKIQKLIELTEARIREGITTSIERAPLYRAIDTALEVPLAQASHTLAKTFANLRRESGSLDENDMRISKELGIENMLHSDMDQATGRQRLDKLGRPVFKLNVPTYFQVFVPLVLAYCKARHAKLWNVHNTDPFLQYDPLVPNRSNKLRCQIVGARASMACNDAGVQEQFKQATWQALIYQRALMLPREPWWRKCVIDPAGGKHVVREGIRYDVPHPTRSYVDQRFPFHTINTDSGVEYYMSWDVYRWGEILRDESLWLDRSDKNSVRIPAGVKSPFLGNAWSTYAFLYPTAISIARPDLKDGDDRLESAFTYTQDQLDKGVPVVTAYQSLIPSEWDLFDYEEPVWFRWLSVFETSPLLVEPMLYRPGSGLTYDDDANRAVGTSLALEVLPFQDQVGQLLSQYLDAVRGNSLRIVLYDSHMLPKDVANKLEGADSTVHRVELIPVDFDLLRASGSDAKTLFAPIRFDQIDTDQIMRSITMTVSLMERVLGFSAQEVGAPSSASQTATSVTMTASYVQERQTSTAGGISAGKAALKDSIYGAFMAYGDDQIMASVEDFAEGDMELLASLGFTAEIHDGVMGVMGPKAILSAMRFASRREGVLKGSESAVAQQMLQVFQVIFSRPEIVQAVGVDSVIEWFNQIAIYAGLPTDMRLMMKQNGPGGPGGPGGAGPTPQQVAQMVQKICGDMLKQAGSSIEQDAAKQIDALKTEIAQAIKALAGRVSKVEGASGVQPAGQAPVQVPVPVPVQQPMPMPQGMPQGMPMPGMPPQ